MKILFVASHGGHWVQLKRIASAFNDYEKSYITTNKGVASEVKPDSVFFVTDASMDSKIALLISALEVLILIFKIRPNVVLSTGAAPGFFALMFGKLLGSKTIWIDSIANANELSLSGKMVGKFADLWLTQWPELEQEGGPYYRGSVI